METIEYFAYGSNMSSESMRAICATERFLGPARLAGHRLTFSRRSVLTGTGVADIVADPDRDVWGALYAIGLSELERLDRKEGLGFAYERREVVVRTGEMTAHQAIAYSVIAKEAEEICPSVEYVRLLLAGAAERSLPAEYVFSLQASAVSWGLG
jgi:gamma-glutamylcyclotransferase